MPQDHADADEDEGHEHETADGDGDISSRPPTALKSNSPPSAWGFARSRSISHCRSVDVVMSGIFPKVHTLPRPQSRLQSKWALIISQGNSRPSPRSALAGPAKR